ncbi:ATP-binding protein [bacterium]|nr:ATP-binding protein [bacterium]
MKKTIDIKIYSDFIYLAYVRRFVESIGQEEVWDSDVTEQVVISVDEAVTNVMEHAYECKQGCPIKISFVIEVDKFSVFIIDQGKSFDFRQLLMGDIEKKLEERLRRGRGTIIMKRFMDTLEYRSEEGKGNILKMVKHL